MKSLLELSRFYNQPDSMEILTVTMPVIVEACRLDVSIEQTGEMAPTVATAFDIDAYLDSPHLVKPYEMRVVVAPEHGAIYQVPQPAPLFGDALSFDVMRATWFRAGVGMSYRKWALATWDDNADTITVLASLVDSPLTPVDVVVSDVEGRTNACIITPDICYVRIDPSKQ